MSMWSFIQWLAVLAVLLLSLTMIGLSGSSVAVIGFFGALICGALPFHLATTAKLRRESN